MKQIVDKLNKIAKAIDENVDIPNTDLITDSLDAITKAYGGTPNNSNLIVDKLEDIAGVVSKGGGDEPTVYIPEQTVTTEYDEGYGAYLSTITTNFDLDDLPPYLMLTVDDATIQLEREDEYNFQSVNYGVYYNIDDEVWVFGAWNDGQSDTYTIYGTYEEPTFSKATVTFTNNTSAAVYFHIPHISANKMYTNLRVARDAIDDVEIALYNGLCVGLSMSIGVDLSVTGDIELDEEGTTLFISGDGTVTVSGSGGEGK